MVLKTLALLLSMLLFTAVMYGLHLIIDNVGSDIGTAARIVHAMGDDPSFIFSIDPADVHLDNENLPGDEELKHAAYVVGPKFILYLLATLVYWLLGFLFSRTDPLSALFFTNLFCFFGSSILIYLIALKSGKVSNRIFYFLLPILFLSLPSTYYLVHDPSYPHVITFFLLSSIYLVMSSYGGDSKRLALHLFASGFVIGLTFGVGSQAPLCIFAAVVFTGFVAFSKRLFFRSIFLQALGVFFAIALSELAFQIHGTSFIQWTWLHIHENIYSNQLNEPFPFIPFVYFRILFALTPATLIVFLSGCCLYKLWWKNVSLEGRSLLLTLAVVIVTMSFLPSTPLFRIIFPFFIIMQVCNFLMVLNMDKKILKYVVIALLLSETLVTLPSALFIRIEQGDYKSPIMRFEKEITIARYFGYSK